jgi:hypothetical protein
MQDGMLITALCLTVLAIFHSYLGERYLLQPLLRWPNFPRLAIGEPFAKGTLRFAWHLTSLAWLALAAMAIRGECSRVLLAIMLALSGILAHAFTRGRHAAWAVFIVGAVAAATSASTGTFWLRSAAALGALLLLAIGALHVVWACGVRWGSVSAVPELNGRPLFVPPRMLTSLVALALFAATWLTLALGRFVPAPLPFVWLRYAGAAIAVVFALRTIGDLRFVGLFKRVRDTSFARFDDLVFTPLCFFLSTVLVLQLV